MKFGAIITAGGSSKRFGNKNKLLEKINNKTIIEYTVEKFLKANLDEIVISANPQIIKDLENIFTNPKIKIVTRRKTFNFAPNNRTGKKRGCRKKSRISNDKNNRHDKRG